MSLPCSDSPAVGSGGARNSKCRVGVGLIRHVCAPAVLLSSQDVFDLVCVQWCVSGADECVSAILSF